MSIQKVPTGQSVLSRDNEVDSSELWEQLLLSAEQVLQGSEVGGAFAYIADRNIRRRLASELMLGDRELDDGWRRMFLRHSSNSNPAIPPETPLVVDSPEPPSFVRIDTEDPLPRCWKRFRHPCLPATARCRNRHQAAEAFPFLVQLAVHVAHSEERWPRVLSAWRVIDAIDEGSPLIPALGEFLSLGKAEIRASKSMVPIDWHLDDSWSEIRRLLRTVVLLPSQLRPTSPPDWNTVFRNLALLVVVARVARAQLSMAIEMISSRYAELALLRNQPKAEARRMLVLLAKDLQVKKMTVEKLSRLDLAWLRKADPNCWRHQRAARVSLKTIQGWSLRSIVSLAELSLEGNEMTNCVARVHSRDLLLGHASFFSIRSADETERLTMMVTQNLEERTIDITLAGPGNQPVTTRAIHAAIELIGLSWPEIQLGRVVLN